MTYDPILPFDSQGANNLIEVIHPGKRSEGKAVFPTCWDGASLRIGDTETLRDWFLRCVHEFGDVSPFQIEENMACLVVIKWKDGIIQYINFQALVCLDRSLEQYYCEPGSNEELLYLRLDYDLSALGELFSHPHPHLHLQAKDTPRFHLGQINTGNSVIDFMDFIYRNFYHRAWLRWVQAITDKHITEAVHRGELSKVEEAYKLSDPQVIEKNHAAYIIKIKQSLVDWKKGKYPLTIDQNRCDLIRV